MSSKYSTTQSLKERFESKIIAEPNTGCWLWTGSMCSKGYGRLYGGVQTGRVLWAHRIAWELYKGPIPFGLHCLHHCDTPQCVNPHHLFLGTNFDNQQDSVKKGRHHAQSMPGVSHPMAKLTEEQVFQIRADTRKYSEIGASYGVCYGTVASIKQGWRWRHI